MKKAAEWLPLGEFTPVVQKELTHFAERNGNLGRDVVDRGMAAAKIMRRWVAVCCAVGIFVFVARGQQAGSTFEWKRVSEMPLLAPQGNGWESAGTFNPAVVMRDGKFVMLYRAQDARGTSRLGYADSLDGIHFTRRAEPVLTPEGPYEKDGGVEDPRIVKIGVTY